MVVPASNGNYDDLPVFEGGQIGPQGQKRTTSYYPSGTIIKLNGTAAVSDTFVSGEGVQVIQEIENKTASWMSLGVAQDDILILNFGGDTNVSRPITETIGNEYLAVATPFAIGAGATEMFVYHDNWSVEISDAGQAEAAKSNKIQKSRNDLKYFYLEMICCGSSSNILCMIIYLIFIW